MNTIRIPEKPITLVQAAHLLADAAASGNPDAFRWSLNELLVKAQSGVLRGRNPLTLAPIDVVGISPDDYANCMVLTVGDLRQLAIERSLQIEVDDAATLVSAPHATRLNAPRVAACSTIITNSTRKRRDTLTPVIEQAQSQCKNRNDTAEVWAALLVLAEKQQAPLMGATEEGIQYLKDGLAAIFKRDSLRKRLGR